MAEYIRFKWTRAKAGVTMAFLALLGGAVERAANADAARGHVAASNPATWTPKLSLGGLNGNLRTSLIKIEKDFASLYQKDKKAIAAVSIKDDKAIAGDRPTSWRTSIPSSRLNGTFLTQADAAIKFLPAQGEAANSAELNGKPASAFISGAGAIATGGTTATLTAA